MKVYCVFEWQYCSLVKVYQDYDRARAVVDSSNGLFYMEESELVLESECTFECEAE